MTVDQHYKILEILEPTVGETRAKEFTKAIEEVINNKFDTRTNGLATKLDLKTDLAEVKFDILKWVIIALAGQTGTILGFLYFILKK